MDIVIPYGGDGESIKYALRSIEKNFDYDNIFIVTNKPCEHLNRKNLIFVNQGDTHTSNKDANLFDKVLAACLMGLSENFMFWSDDQAIIMPHDIKYVYNVRNPLVMIPTCKWEQRLVRTGYFIKEFLNKELKFNFDSHVPQLMKRDEFIKIKGIDYQSGLGFTICTLYFGIAGWEDRELVEQRTVKATFEGGHLDKKETVGKNWIGWDRATYERTGLRRYLEELFPNKSKFEN
jgi:hypothetical protein